MVALIRLDMTMALDGYVTGPDDGPEYGLGKGGERLHYWVMGGPWTYEGGHDFAMHGPDKEFYDEIVSTIRAGVVGRGMYDAAGAWGGRITSPSAAASSDSIELSCAGNGVATKPDSVRSIRARR